MRRPSDSGINAPAVTSSLVDIADWLELVAIYAGGHFVGRSDLHNWLDVAEDYDGLASSEELDERKEQLISDVLIEISRRSKASGVAYPFNVIAERDVMSLRNRPWNSGVYAYLYGVFTTEAAFHRFLEERFFDANDRRLIPELLQIIATVAAAGFVGGSSASFGWPRPGARNLLTTLRDLTARSILEGAARAKPRPGAPKNAKDGGIDIIAWRHFPDSLPGKLILYGQCASGKKWEDKGIRNYSKTFARDYFDDGGFACEPIEAMFIPFCIGPMRKFYSASSVDETISAMFHRFGTKVGIVFDRCRISNMLPNGVSQFEGGNLVERCSDLSRVSDWVEVCIDWLQERRAA